MDDKVKYLSIKQIVDSEDYPFSLGQIRHYLTMRHRNGLDKAVRKIGKRIFLRKDSLDAWIESQSSIGGQS